MTVGSFAYQTIITLGWFLFVCGAVFVAVIVIVTILFKIEDVYLTRQKNKTAKERYEREGR